MSTEFASCSACGVTVTCPSSDSCSIVCVGDCSSCIIQCGPFVDPPPHWPVLLKAEKITSTGSNLERALLADYLGGLLGTTMTPTTDTAERVNVSEFTGTVEELLDHVGLRPEGYLRG